MTATLSIRETTFSFNTDDENNSTQDVIVTAPSGIDPNSNLKVELLESEKTEEDFEEFLEKGQRVAVAYDVKLLKDGISVQPDGTLKIKILIPEELKGKEFGVMHIHNGNQTIMLEYTIDGKNEKDAKNKLEKYKTTIKTKLGLN